MQATHRAKIQGLIGADRFRVVNGAGHFIFFDQKDAFLDAFDAAMRALQ